MEVLIEYEQFKPSLLSLIPSTLSLHISFPSFLSCKSLAFPLPPKLAALPSVDFHPDLVLSPFGDSENSTWIACRAHPSSFETKVCVLGGKDENDQRQVLTG